MIRLTSGRLVLVGQKVIPWRHVSLTYVSDDRGKTWKASNLLDMETKDGGDHGGTIEAKSDGPNKGSTFLVHLPRRAAEELSVAA